MYKVQYLLTAKSFEWVPSTLNLKLVFFSMNHDFVLAIVNIKTK